MTLTRWAFVALWLAIGARAQAQATYRDFQELRPDGNGVAALRGSISTGFARQPATAALTSIALQAQISLTFEATHANFQALVDVPEHSRTVAAALLEVARQCDARVLVSNRGQVVVSPNEHARAPVARAAPTASDTSSTTGDAYALPKLRVEAVRTERLAFDNSPHVSALTMNADALRATPTFVEPDVLRSIQLLPGIEARSDWSAGFNVRGGEADQSLVLLDGYPIYNPFHLGGLFSTFIDPAVGHVELHTGALPARFGGRLSGALDVSSAQPTSSEKHGTAEVSLISSSASLGKTFADGQGSWLVAARRSYPDVLVNLVKPGAFPYHFDDMQLHVARRFDSGLEVSTTGYFGSDVARGDGTDQPYGGWGNSVLGVTARKDLAHGVRLPGALFGDSASVTQSASWSRFWAVGDFNRYRSRVDNDVTDLRVNGALSLFSGSRTLTLGYEVATQALRYRAGTAVEDLGDLFPVDSSQRFIHAQAAWLSYLWRPSDRLLVDLGARLEHTDAATGAGFSPRLSAKYFVSPDLAISAGVGRYAQWMHSLGRGEEPLQPFQFWVATPRGGQASVMHDAAVGLEQWRTPTQLLHVGAFFKRYDRLYVPNVNSDPLVEDDELKAVSGSTYGLDFMWRKLEGGPFSGWISYSYALSSRLDGAGYRYYPPQDRRHNLNLVGSWKADDYTFGLRLNLASGLPTTPVTGVFARSRYDVATQRWVTDFETNGIAAPFDSDRLPWYERLDASVTRNGRLFGMPVKPYLSIVNVLNSSNPAGYLYTYGIRSQRTSFPNLPFVPTLGVSIAY